MSRYVTMDDMYEREFELEEEIKRLHGQITYLQEELAMTEDLLNEANDRLAEYDEGFM